jgi:hypothetical protein
VSQTGVWTTPDANHVVVVAAGAGYYVDVRDPLQWQEVPIFPIRIVLPLVEAQLLILGDFARLAAYGSTGLRWMTADFVWDDLEVTSIRKDSIAASGYDAERDRRIDVSIDLDTGYVTGSVQPPAPQG